LAVSAGTAALQVVPTLTKDFSRQLATKMAGPAVKTADRTGRESGQRFGRKFSGGIRAGIGPVRGIFRGLGPGLAAAFGGAALVAGIKSVTAEAREAAIVGRQTAAVLKSTGGAANVSAKDIERLATALSNKSGVDDEAIQTSQNLLLTFTGVRNEAGKGNQVFTQASTSILDMTAAMNGGKVTAQGLKASTIQVGKALNDPIKGMTALSRVGVTFTQGQKDQIKALVESGDKLGAQKIILAELRKEFGGSAAASADAGKRFSVFIGNLKERVGAVLLPILNKFLGFLVDKLPGALTTAGAFFTKLGNAAKGLFDLFVRGDFTGTFAKAFNVSEDAPIVGLLFKIREAVIGAIGWFRRGATTLRGLLLPAISSIAGALKPAVAAFVSGLLPGLKSLWHVIQAQVFPALKIVAAIIGVTLYAALRFVLPFILRLAGPVLGFLIKQIAQTIQWVSNVIRWIGRVVAWLLRWVTGTKTTGDAIKTLGAIAVKIFNFIRDKVGAVIVFIIKAFRGWFNVATTVVLGILRMFGKLPGPLGAPFRKAEEAVKKAKQTIDGQMDRIQSRINRLRGKTVDVKARAAVEIAKSTRLYLKAAQVPGFHARGTLLPGYGGGDIVPAMLEPGEAVVPKDKARRPEFRSWARSMGIPGFQRGGIVGDLSSRFYDPTVAGTRKLGKRVADFLARSVGKGLSKAIEKGLGGGSTAIKAFIKSTDALPYVWGAAGPGSYDCSGLVSAVLGKMTGRGGGRGQRYFTTGSIRSGILGIKSGLGGVLQIGVTSGSGHMAGRYGGLGFEAESSRTGIKTGTAASRPEGFARHFHLAKGGRIDREMAAQVASLAGADVGGDQGRLRVNGLAFAKGGYLNPRVFSYAKRLLQRIRSGAQVSEDFTWRGMPRSYGRWNAEVQRRVFENLTGGYDFPRDLKKVGPILGSLIHRSAHRARSGFAAALETALRQGRTIYEDLSWRGPGDEPYSDSIRFGTARRLGLGRAWKGDHWDQRAMLRILSARSFDNGGVLAPGLNLLDNRTGRPEPLVPAGGIDYDRLAQALVRALRREPLTAVVSPRAFQAGMNHHAGLMGQARPYR
jgi:hypothetical protein